MTPVSVSFEECNQRLLSNNIIVDLREYVMLTHTIPFIGNQDSNPVEIAELINFIISIMDYHPHDFSISLDTIEKFGFVPNNTIANKFRLFTNKPVNRIENERSFMRKNKLKLNVDYILYRQRISSFEFELDLGYKMTNLAFFKLMNIHYDRIFLTLLDARIFQIVSNFRKYLFEFYDDRIIMLQRTIHGLTEDITKLVASHSNISKSVINEVSGESYECSYDCLRNSYNSNRSYSGSYESECIIGTPIAKAEDNWLYSDRLTLLTPPSPGSPVDAILELSQPNTLDSIHKKLFDLIQSPTRSNNSSIHSNHIDLLRRRFSTCLLNEPNKEPLRCSIA